MLDDAEKRKEFRAFIEQKLHERAAKRLSPVIGVLLPMLTLLMIFPLVVFVHPSSPTYSILLIALIAFSVFGWAFIPSWLAIRVTDWLLRDRDN